MIRDFFKIKRIRTNKKENNYSELIGLLKSLRKETPNISLPFLYFPPKKSLIQKETKTNTWLWKAVSFSLAFVFVLFLINSGVFNFKKAKLSGLNQKAIAKELQTIETNKPTKSLEIDKKVDKLLNQSKNKDLKGLDQESINSEIKKIQKTKLKTEEVDALIDNF